MLPLAGAVLDHELLAEALRQPLPDHAGRCIGGAAGRKTENDAHRPRRIGLRPGSARYRWRCNDARGKPQETTAVRSHRH
jgi:hypothetical protein